MNPEFNDGDIIVVDPDIEPQSGDYVVIKDAESNEATFKQLIRNGKKTILHCLNKKYASIELDGKKQYSVVGKVVEKVKKY